MTMCDLYNHSMNMREINYLHISFWMQLSDNPPLPIQFSTIAERARLSSPGSSSLSLADQVLSANNASVGSGAGDAVVNGSSYSALFQAMDTSPPDGLVTPLE